MGWCSGWGKEGMGLEERQGTGILIKVTNRETIMRGVETKVEKMKGWRKGEKGNTYDWEWRRREER